MKETFTSQEQSTATYKQHTHTILLTLFLCTFVVVLLRTAWMSDDAYITWRTIDNFVNGYGLTWNTTERVQAYTHPLWMFLLSFVYLFTGEAFFSTIAISIVLSLVTLLLLVYGIARSLPGALLGITILLFSRAYIDFSTSGLENPLTHFLLVLFFALYLRGEFTFRRLTMLALIAALGVLNRMDTLWLFAPALIYAMGHAVRTLRWRTFIAVGLGFVPFILWELFSLWYYGFLFPNTAYAKLNTGIERAELVEQGMLYLLNSLNRDPITLIMIGCGLVIPLGTRRWHTLPIALGSLLYVIYVVRIGGDFMSGRFLAAPLLCSVIVIVYSFTTHSLTHGLVALLVTALVGWAPDMVTLKSDAAYRSTHDSNHITDERTAYYPSSGLLNVVRGHDMPRSDTDVFHRNFHGQQASNETIVVKATIGLIGFRAGPNVHIVDYVALADPLLARLPSRRDMGWMSGHFIRVLPDGYLKTLELGENVIEDESLARYYDHLTTVTRGPLFDLSRLGEIWRINTGAYDHLIDADAYRYPTMVKVDLHTMNTDDHSTYDLTDSGIEIDLEGQQHHPYLEIELGQQHDHRILYLNDGREVARQDVKASLLSPTPLALSLLEVPPEAIARGYTHLRVLPTKPGGGLVGAVRLLTTPDEMTPHIVLGWGWEAQQGSDRWAVSPANVHLISPHQQPALLEITFSGMYDPQSGAAPPLGDHGILNIFSQRMLLASIPITTNESVSMPVPLLAGRHTLTFELQAGNFVADGLTRSFAIDSMKLQPISHPEDMHVNQQPQDTLTGTQQDIMALYGRNWYERETTRSLRWAQSPADLIIVSPTEQWAELRLLPSAMHDPDGANGMGYQGTMHITVNEAPSYEQLAVVGQPLITEIPLRAGVNRVTLTWEHGNFRPNAFHRRNPDQRLLSFAVEHIDIRTTK